MHKDVEEKSLTELAPSYEVGSTYLVHMLEARFVSLNPFMKHMFLKLHDIEDPEKKILSWKLCLENLEILLLKLGKFLSILISLARM
jgi:hypothetical protein